MDYPFVFVANWHHIKNSVMHHHFWFRLVAFTLIFISVVILIVSLYNKHLKYKERSWAFLLKKDNNKALAPLRISAYERIVVMLERITPQSLVMRHNLSTTSAAFLQIELIKALREEFDHNVSLQMYVSADCWDKVKRARDETAELIKVAFSRVRAEGPSIELSAEVLKLDATVGSSAIREALLSIRMEMAKYF